MLPRNIWQVFAWLSVGFFSFFGSISSSHEKKRAFDCSQVLTINGWLRFDADRAMPAGPFKGRPLAIATPAPALKILSTEEFLRLFPHINVENKWAVANFITRHGPSIALIPKVAPETITLVKEEEVDGTDHVLLRLIFPETDKILFWPQNLEGLSDPPKSIRDVVIDFGTHRVQGQENRHYTAFRGLRRHYALQSRMSTTWFKVARVKKDGRAITEFPMDVSDQEKIEMLNYFVTRTQEISAGEMYHTVVKNCATEFFLLFSSVITDLNMNCSLSKRVLHYLISWTPGGLLCSLREKGLKISPQDIEIEISPDERH